MLLEERVLCKGSDEKEFTVSGSIRSGRGGDLYTYDGVEAFDDGITLMVHNTSTTRQLATNTSDWNIFLKRTYGEDRSFTIESLNYTKARRYLKIKLLG